MTNHQVNQNLKPPTSPFRSLHRNCQLNGGEIYQVISPESFAVPLSPPQSAAENKDLFYTESFSSGVWVIPQFSTIQVRPPHFCCYASKESDKSSGADFLKSFKAFPGTNVLSLLGNFLISNGFQHKNATKSQSCTDLDGKSSKGWALDAWIWLKMAKNVATGLFLFRKQDCLIHFWDKNVFYFEAKSEKWGLSEIFGQ